MNRTSIAPSITRPDLAPLLEGDPETVAHILCAEFGGAEWRRAPRGGGDLGVWMLVGTTAEVDIFPNGIVKQRHLPRPMHDDADAWRLFVREGLNAHRTGPTWWRVEWTEDGREGGYCEGPDPRRQCVRAALNKHAHDPRWSDLIPSVIERLEQAQ